MATDNAILDYPQAYRGLTLNEHRNTDGTIDASKVEDTILVEQFNFSPIQFRDQRDPLHLLIGGDLGLVSSGFRFLNLSGKVKGSTWAALEDRIAKMNAAFHPENAVDASASTRGVSAFDFYCPTAEAGYTSPVHECFFGRPTSIPSTYERRASGLVIPFAVELVCTPPGRYLYTAESKTANAGNGWSIALPNWTSTLGYRVVPILTIVLTGAGSSACTIRYVEGSVTTNLVLDLSGVGAGSHTITWENNVGYVDGVRNDALRTSAVNTCWSIGPGGGTMSVPSGRTNLSSVTAAYRQARA